jgi:hypothetical protein
MYNSPENKVHAEHSAWNCLTLIAGYKLFDPLFIRGYTMMEINNFPAMQP